VLSLGMLSLAMLPADPSALEIGVRMVICGLGFGFFQSPNQKALMTSAPRERSSGASGMIATARLLGQSTGAALVALSFGLSSHSGPILALYIGAGFAAVACLASFSRLAARNPA